MLFRSVLVAFAVACVAIIILLVIYRLFNYANMLKYLNVTYAALYVLIAAGAAGFVCGIIRLRRDAEASRRDRIITGPWLMAVSAATLVSFVLIRLYGSAPISLLYIIVPALCVLYLIYLIYMTEFFAVAFLSASGGFLAWILNRLLLGGRGARGITVAVLILLFYLASFILFFISSKNGGALKLFKKKYQFMPRNSKYGFIYLCCAICFLCTLAALIFGAAAAFYSIFVVFAYLFVMTVYYTVKLM